MNKEKPQAEIKPQPMEVLAPPIRAASGLSIFETAERFEHFQRVAKAFASSNLVPEKFQGNVANALIAMDMADRLGANPLAVMQSIYIVHGNPSWAATFVIAMINSCGKFKPLRFELAGAGDDYGCVAHTTERGGGEPLRSPRVTIKMAKEEGWFNRNGSKWKTMPEVMLHYRSATFFGRLYAPELLMGMKTQDEIVDVYGEEKAKPWKPTHGPTLAQSSVLVSITPEPEQAVEVMPAVKLEPQEQQQSHMGLAPSKPAKMSPQEELRLVIEGGGYTIDQFKAWAEGAAQFKDADSIATWDEIPTADAKRLLRVRAEVLKHLASQEGSKV